MTIEKRRQYNFGLGKRREGEEDPDNSRRLSKETKSILEGLLKLYDDAPSSVGVKRSKPQRFSFGLGKRAMEEVYGQEEDIGAGDNRQWIESDYAAEKRKPQRYQFGIGKRSWFFPANNPVANKKISNFEEFMKRRYSFGLGK